jgi:hypothetical protein
MASTYSPIQTQTLGSNQSTVTLSSIPSTYTDLILVVNAKWSTTNGNCLVRFNGDSASNYNYLRLSTNGSVTASATGNNQSSLVNLFDIENPTTTLGFFMFYIKDYASTNNKVAWYSHNTTTDNLKRYIAQWRSSSTINSISFTNDNATCVTGSTFTLYGIKAA